MNKPFNFVRFDGHFANLECLIHYYSSRNQSNFSRFYKSVINTSVQNSPCENFLWRDDMHTGTTKTLFSIGLRTIYVLMILSMLLSAVGINPVSAAPKDTALQFDGTNDYVTFGSSAGLTQLGVQVFTIETWFKRTGTGIATSTGTGGLSAAIPLVTKGRGEGDNSNLDMNYFFGIDNATNRLAADFEECASGMGAPCVAGGTAGLIIQPLVLLPYKITSGTMQL